MTEVSRKISEHTQCRSGVATGTLRQYISPKEGNHRDCHINGKLPLMHQ